MLNGNEVNSSPINSPDSVSGVSSGLGVTSFSTTLGTKYGFRGADGLYFQLNSVELRTSRYGNVLESHDMDDSAEVETVRYANALKNGGTIYDRRYKEKKFSLSFTLYSDTLENLEAEIRNLKAAMESGGYLYKAEKSETLRVSVKLEEFSVSRLRLVGTTVKAKLLTTDPFWSSVNSVTSFCEGNVGSFSGSVTLSKTGIRGFVKHLMYLRTVTGTVNQLTLTVAGYPIRISGTFSSGDSVILDGIGNYATVNGAVTKYYGQFPELEPNVTYPVSVAFAWGGSVDSFDLYNIYEKKRL